MQTMTKIVHDRVSSSYPQTMCIDTGGSINAIAQNKDGSQVVVGGRSVFKIYSIEDDSFQEKCNLRVGKHVNLNYCATDIAWNYTDENILATGATNGAVVIWDLSRTSRCKQEHVFNEHKRTVNRVCFHEKEPPLLLSASQDGSIKLFDLRAKNTHSTFSTGSTSVRDVQFCPASLIYFGFASAGEDGNVQVWDLRRPDKVEKHFLAHTGPVFSLTWHLEERNWLATAGRDKTIKVWDPMSQTGLKCLYTIYTIASVARIRWRPQRKFHIASCALLVDNSINIWDVRRPYVPFASFEKHRDITTSIAFRNKDPHIILSGSKDSFIYQHVFRDACRPGEDLVPAGLDINVFGTIGHANSDKQGKINVGDGSGGLLTALLPKKNLGFSDQFVDVSSFMQVFENTGQDLSWFYECAIKYKLKGQSLEELCKHNSIVAQSQNRNQIAQIWLYLMTMYSSHNVEHKTVQQGRTTSNFSAINTERLDLHVEKVKPTKDICRDTDAEDKFDGTSGNSDDETDDREMFDMKLASIACGQANTECDIFFGDGEPGPYKTLSNNVYSHNKKEWVLPNEAFYPRHEIHDRVTPCETLDSSAEMHMLTDETENKSEEPVSDDDNISTSILMVDNGFLKHPELDFKNHVLEILQDFAAEGDVQTPVTMLIVFKDKIQHLVEKELQEDWFLSYIDLLRRFKLWTIANEVIKLSELSQVSMLNQQSTTIHVNCNVCNKPLHRSGWLCDRCKMITNKCCVCSLPVKGLFMWCQGCSHGGHLQHVKDWFSRNTECPTGCGHICEYT